MDDVTVQPGLPAKSFPVYDLATIIVAKLYPGYDLAMGVLAKLQQGEFHNQIIPWVKKSGGGYGLAAKVVISSIYNVCVS